MILAYFKNACNCKKAAFSRVIDYINYFVYIGKRACDGGFRMPRQA